MKKYILSLIAIPFFKHGILNSELVFVDMVRDDFPRFIMSFIFSQLPVSKEGKIIESSKHKILCAVSDKPKRKGRGLLLKNTLF